jgi:hypothetical protein
MGGNRLFSDGGLHIFDDTDSIRWTVVTSEAGPHCVDVMIEHKRSLGGEWVAADRIHAISAKMLMRLARAAELLDQWDTLIEHDDGP